jgi:hypothetical protein
MTKYPRISTLLILVLSGTVISPYADAADYGIHSYVVGSESVSIGILGEMSAPISEPPIVGDLVQVGYPVGTATGKYACKYFFDVVIWHNNTKVEESFQVQEDSLAKPSVFIRSPGDYDVEIIGESHCRDSGTKDLGASMNHRWTAFTAISAKVPAKTAVTKMTCNPSFRISTTKENPYSCVTTIADPDHVVDYLLFTPAEGTRMSPGPIGLKYSAKSWKRTKNGWTINTSFKLLTVSPFDFSKLRSIERFQNRVDAVDTKLDSSLGFNKQAETNSAYFTFAFKK